MSKSVSSSTAMGIAIVALIVALAGLAIPMIAPSSASNSQVVSLQSQVSQLQNAVSSVAVVDQPPSVDAIKLDWCLSPAAMQDRYCPSNQFTVVQGDIVQILFISNDTDAHTFTLLPPYNFQINDTVGGLLNFLLGAEQYTGPCVNGNYADESAGVSPVYCVSGTSLLSPTYLTANNAEMYAISQNPNPGLNYGTCQLPAVCSGESNYPSPKLIAVDDSVHYGDSANLAGVFIPANATSSEEWGIGAFQASYAGIIEFECVYHVSNGMFGYMTVLPNAYCNTNPTACGITSSSSSSAIQAPFYSTGNVSPANDFALQPMLAPATTDQHP